MLSRKKPELAEVFSNAPANHDVSLLKDGSSHDGIHPAFHIGIKEMDAQHAHWIRLIEAFRSVGSEQLLELSGIAAARNALEALFKYTKQHFASEEKLLAAHGYPKLDSHKQQHREIENVVSKLLEEARAYQRAVRLSNSICT